MATTSSQEPLLSPPLGPVGEASSTLPDTELECETLDAIEKLIAKPDFLAAMTMQIGASSTTGEMPLPSKRRTILRWGSKQIELQQRPNDKLYKPVPSEVEPTTTEEDMNISAASDAASGTPFLLVESPSIPTDAVEDGFVVVEKTDAVEALAYYIAMCVMSAPEAQAVAPAVLQKALVQTLKGLRQSRFKQMCSWGRQVYKWSTLSYSALQMYQNPWMIRAVLMAIWYASRTCLRLMV